MYSTRYTQQDTPEPYGTEPQSRPIPRQITSGQGQLPIHQMNAPYYMPPYYPIPPLGKGPTTTIVDQRLPMVPFKFRPRALKITIVLIILGVTLCTIGILRILSFSRYFLNDFGYTLFLSYLLIVNILGICSLILLLLPRKIGWYLTFITSVVALGGFGIGTVVAIFAIVSLLWPSVRYYFHTGQYPPIMYSPMMQLPGLTDFQGRTTYNVPPYPTENLQLLFDPTQRPEREMRR